MSGAVTVASGRAESRAAINATPTNGSGTPTPPMHCVPGSARRPGTEPAWLCALDGHLAPALRRLDEDKRLELARLIPALLCGEQSAVAIFHAEARRLETAAHLTSVALFRAIENDELSHERGLQAMLHVLPVPEDQHTIKRRAQCFYARLGRTAGVAEHFAQIAHLDAAVCRIMRELEGSALAREPVISALFGQLKRDEARHVSVSRWHAAALGMPRREQDALGEDLRKRLVDFLAPLGDAFDALQVDPERLFTRLRRGLPT